MVRKINDSEGINQIIFAGDIHGEFKTFMYVVRHIYNLSDCLIIMAGDFGVGFYKPNYYKQELGAMNRQLAGRNIELVALRGNHDNPSYFDGGYRLSNIQLAADYDVVEFGSSRILLVGGARSIDKYDRLLNYDYWPDEMPVFDQAKLDLAGDVNCICTHTCPSLIGTRALSDNIKKWVANDPTLLDDIKLEGEILDKIYNAKSDKLKSWYYGHFHMAKTNYINGIKFVMLDRLYTERRVGQGLMPALELQ